VLGRVHCRALYIVFRGSQDINDTRLVLDCGLGPFYADPSALNPQPEPLPAPDEPPRGPALSQACRQATIATL
jgi:hypothetical protein